MFRTSTHSLLAAFFSIGLVSAAGADSWNDDGDGFTWSDADNWVFDVVPSSTDSAFIGNLAGVENGQVWLDVNDTVAGLSMSDGMALRTEGFRLLVNGETFLTGENTTVNHVIYRSGLVIERGVALNDFDTDILGVYDGASLRLEDGGILEVDQVATIGENAALRGDGIVNLAQGSGTVLINDGLIDPTVQGMTINALGSGLIDLDGTSGDGRVGISTSMTDGSAFDNLTINATGLTDAFDGEISMTSNAFLNMNLANPWTLGAGGVLSVFGNLNHPGPAAINGAPVTVAGTVEATPASAHAQFNADTTFAATAQVVLMTDDQLEVNGAADVQGASFSIGEDSEVNFDGATTVGSATFNFDNPNSGVVRFNGPTTHTFNTQITSNGLIQQSGDATVVGNMVVNGGRFDLDGAFGTTTINLGNAANNGSLTLNVEAIDQTNNVFDGTINTAEAGLTGKLTVNTNSGQWGMLGTLNLTGNGGLGRPVRVAGSEMIVSGTVNVANDATTIASDVQFTNSAVVNFASLGSELNVTGDTVVYTHADFNNFGTFYNRGGDLTMWDGVDFSLGRLINGGTMRIGDNPGDTGQATATRFTQTDTGTWEVEIGGMTPGVEHDQFVAGGTVELAGTLDLTLINGYSPSEGNVSVIFDGGVGGIDGVFDQVTGSGFVVSPTLRSAVLYDADAVRVYTALFGDVNLNGQVEQGDLDIILQNWGMDDGASWVTGDMTGNGQVEQGDLDGVLQNWGATAAPDFTGHAVPEPVSVATLAGAAVLCFRRPRHRDTR